MAEYKGILNPVPKNRGGYESWTFIEETASVAENGSVTVNIPDLANYSEIAIATSFNGGFSYSSIGIMPNVSGIGMVRFYHDINGTSQGKTEVSIGVNSVLISNRINESAKYRVYVK